MRFFVCLFFVLMVAFSVNWQGLIGASSGLMLLGDQGCGVHTHLRRSSNGKAVTRGPMSSEDLAPRRNCRFTGGDYQDFRPQDEETHSKRGCG